MMPSLMLLACFDLPKIGAQVFSHQSYESAFTAFCPQMGQKLQVTKAWYIKIEWEEIAALSI